MYQIRIAGILKKDTFGTEAEAIEWAKCIPSQLEWSVEPAVSERQQQLETIHMDKRPVPNQDMDQAEANGGYDPRYDG